MDVLAFVRNLKEIAQTKAFFGSLILERNTAKKYKSLRIRYQLFVILVYKFKNTSYNFKPQQQE